MPAVRHRLPIAPATLHDFDAALASHRVAPLQRGVVTTLQVNVGKLCNQACHHCHVEAGPKRTEIMSEAVATRVLELLATSPRITTLDLTGGAPEMNPSFRRIVVEARRLGKRVIDRCNLTILFEPGMADLATFLADHDVEVVASLPCYTADNVEQQRGHGVFAKSIAALRQLNGLGYGPPGSARARPRLQPRRRVPATGAGAARGAHDLRARHARSALGRTDRDRRALLRLHRRHGIELRREPRMTHVPAIAVLGGSGFYELPGATITDEVRVETPFGSPSDVVVVARLADRRVLFLARHGRGHRLLPSEINARANLYALKSLGATQVISVSAVGSLREEIAPGDVVLPRQFIDRTNGRPSTFFGDGVVAHVSLADPVCDPLADALVTGARAEADRVHPRGTYVCIEGPQFGTRAESEMMRGWRADVVGMTNLPEARLAREAELCYATLVLPTDYDCWRTRTDEVRVADVLGVLRANVDKARRIVARTIAGLDPARACACRTSLDTALVTAPELIDVAARTRLAAILARRLGATS